VPEHLTGAIELLGTLERALRVSASAFQIPAGCECIRQVSKTERQKWPHLAILEPVEAGYYDNYGVSVAASWLSMPAVRNWISTNTTGVIVIQINAYDSKFRSEHQGHLEATRPSWWSLAGRFLTSPIDGMGAARESSMLFRNAEQLGGPNHEAFSCVKAAWAKISKAEQPPSMSGASDDWERR
jgi:hypothetical protein